MPEKPQPTDSGRNTSKPTTRADQDLEALLEKAEQKRTTQQAAASDPYRQMDQLDVFRSRMRQIYMPVFEDIKSKYNPRGVEMDLDADEFLGGGAHLRIKLQYFEHVLKMEGTVGRGGVAFYLTRGTGNSNGGAMESGPMLRIRNLSAEDFRQFVVDHLMLLLKESLRKG